MSAGAPSDLTPLRVSEFGAEVTVSVILANWIIPFDHHVGVYRALSNPAVHNASAATGEAAFGKALGRRAFRPVEATLLVAGQR
jgi:hypothetical protein